MIAPAETEGTSPEQRLMFAWRLMFTGRSSNAQLVPMMGGLFHYCIVDGRGEDGRSEWCEWL